MAKTDPFTTAAADEAQTETETTEVATEEKPARTRRTPATKITPKAESEGKGISVTLKGKGRHADPWVVLHAADTADAVETMSDPLFKEVLELAASGAKFFSDLVPDSPAPAGGSGGGNSGPQTAPNGEKRFCAHGEMVFKSGVSKAGKAYKLFECTEKQCKTEWLNDK